MSPPHLMTAANLLAWVSNDWISEHWAGPDVTDDFPVWFTRLMVLLTSIFAVVVYVVIRSKRGAATRRPNEPSE